MAIEKTRQLTHKAIEEGRCYVVQGDVSGIPFEDNKFDLVTAFETVYFWPGLEDCSLSQTSLMVPTPQG